MSKKGPAKRQVVPKHRNIRNIEHLLLNEWIYGMNMAAHMRNPRIFREAALLTSRHWSRETMDERAKGRDDLKAAQKYIQMLDRDGIEDAKRLKLKKVKRDIRLEVTAPCLYGNACTWLLNRKVMPQCARGLKIATGLGAFPAHRYAMKLRSCMPRSKCVIAFERKK